MSMLWGQFNNYATLKLPFFTHLPLTIMHCNISSRESSYVTPHLARTTPPSTLPPPPSTHTHTHASQFYEILGIKKGGSKRSRSKEISFLFHMFFFQPSTNNTKKIICLKSKTCYNCQSLVRTSLESGTKALFTFQSKMERNK